MIDVLVAAQTAEVLGRVFVAVTEWRDRKRDRLSVAVRGGEGRALVASGGAWRDEIGPVFSTYLRVEFTAGTDAAAQLLDGDNPVVVVITDARNQSQDGLVADGFLGDEVHFELAPGLYDVLAIVFDHERDQLVAYGTEPQLPLFDGDDVRLALAILDEDPAWLAAQVFGGPEPIPMLVAENGDWVELADVVLIGRAPQCDLLIDDETVSRRHAELLATGEGYELHDLGSTNGTFVNGERVKVALLQHGDVLQFGDFAVQLIWG